MDSVDPRMFENCYIQVSRNLSKAVLVPLFCSLPIQVDFGKAIENNLFGDGDYNESLSQELGDTLRLILNAAYITPQEFHYQMSGDSSDVLRKIRDQVEMGSDRTGGLTETFLIDAIEKSYSYLAGGSQRDFVSYFEQSIMHPAACLLDQSYKTVRQSATFQIVSQDSSVGLSSSIKASRQYTCFLNDAPVSFISVFAPGSRSSLGMLLHFKVLNSAGNGDIQNFMTSLENRAEAEANFKAAFYSDLHRIIETAAESLIERIILFDGLFMALIYLPSISTGLDDDRDVYSIAKADHVSPTCRQLLIEFNWTPERLPSTLSAPQSPENANDFLVDMVSGTSGTFSSDNFEYHAKELDSPADGEQKSDSPFLNNYDGEVVTDPHEFYIIEGPNQETVDPRELHDGHIHFADELQRNSTSEPSSPIITLDELLHQYEQNDPPASDQYHPIFRTDLEYTTKPVTNRDDVGISPKTLPFTSSPRQSINTVRSLILDHGPTKRKRSRPSISGPMLTEEFAPMSLSRTRSTSSAASNRKLARTLSNPMKSLFHTKKPYFALELHPQRKIRFDLGECIATTVYRNIFRVDVTKIDPMISKTRAKTPIALLSPDDSISALLSSLPPTVIMEKFQSKAHFEHSLYMYRKLRPLYGSRVAKLIGRGKTEDCNELQYYLLYEDLFKKYPGLGQNIQAFSESAYRTVKEVLASEVGDIAFDSEDFVVLNNTVIFARMSFVNPKQKDFDRVNWKAFESIWPHHRLSIAEEETDRTPNKRRILKKLSLVLA